MKKAAYLMLGFLAVSAISGCLGFSISNTRLDDGYSRRSYSLIYPEDDSYSYAQAKAMMKEPGSSAGNTAYNPPVAENSNSMLISIRNYHYYTVEISSGEMSGRILAYGDATPVFRASQGVYKLSYRWVDERGGVHSKTKNYMIDRKTKRLEIYGIR